MRKDRLAQSCAMTVREVKTRLAPWYNDASDCILVPYEDMGQARRRLYKDAKTPATPATPDAGRVLAIAHIDTVLAEHWHKDAGSVFYSPALDDRIGLYTFMWEFDGVVFDLLLTDDEEIGRSTAQWFEAQRGYNWMVQFDRRGTDVVMYQYDTAANRERLARAGAVVGLGTFSDIAYLDGLGVAGFNWGTGYHQEHTRECHVVVTEYEWTLGWFREFYRLYGQERIEHNGEVDEADLGDYDYWREYECEMCGRVITRSVWLDELQCWGCEECARELEGDAWGECVGCGGLASLRLSHAVGEYLCDKCLHWWTR